ncbi:MAG: hypothetical protein WD972_01520, partial [Candidatus Andersenbacteria bacterium]
NLAVFSNRSTLAEAINNVFGSGNTALMAGLADSMRLHQKSLLEQRVPPAAASLHKLLLGYTELVAATYEQMTRYNEDPVKATTALYQLEQIDRKYYPLIEQEVDRLQLLSAQLKGAVSDETEIVHTHN